MARSLNKVTLIGNLTRDPELRYTPQGSAVCSFSVATNRQWVTEAGDKKEDAEFHRIVSWNKLAEICSQLLKKGRKVYVEGRLQTRNWTTQDGQPRQTTEVVITEMILLDSRGAGSEPSDSGEIDIPDSALEMEGDISSQEPAAQAKPEEKPKSEPAQDKKTQDVKGKKTQEDEKTQGTEDDIPF
ncbi:single-stranded DNA-binding protein [Patescibacteria group bacterium]